LPIPPVGVLFSRVFEADAEEHPDALRSGPP